MISSHRVQPLGDSAALVTMGDSVDEMVNRRVHALGRAVLGARIKGVEDVVPSFASLGIYFDPTRISLAEIEALVRELSGNPAIGDEIGDSPAHHLILTTYDGEDLGAVALATGLSHSEIVAIHTAKRYRVFAIGFAPGFGYLGELDARLSVPRKAVPRTRVPAGAVAIAGSQTAVYPLETAGGWQIIGRTEQVMFDSALDRPSLLRAGDTVEFVALA